MLSIKQVCYFNSEIDFYSRRFFSLDGEKCIENKIFQNKSTFSKCVIGWPNESPIRKLRVPYHMLSIKILKKSKSFLLNVHKRFFSQ